MEIHLRKATGKEEWERPPRLSDTAYFHLTSLEGIVEALPLGPVNATCIGEVGPAKVEAIQVGNMTALEPPGTRRQCRTVLHKKVLVPVERGELLAVVVGQ